MTQLFRLLALSALALVAFGSTAVAQDDGPAIVLDPESVEEAGTYDVTVTGSGFTIPVFVLQCPGAGGDVDALIDGGDPTVLCDLASLINATPDADGNFEVTFEGLDVTDCGLVIVAGDLEQIEVGGPELLAVENPADDVECEIVENESYDLDAAGVDADGDGVADDLAETGANTPLLVVIGLSTLVAGAYITFEARRHLLKS